MPNSSLKSGLIALLSEDQVSTADNILEEHAIDKWHASNPPEVVVFAQSTEDVVATMTYAHQHNIPVTTRGAGVGYVGGCVPMKGGIVLSVARMTKIKEIKPEDGVAVVEPGVITGDLQDAAADLGWYYPPDPASLRECSLGGNIATNAGGPRCLKYGVTRPYVIGLEVVLANGDILRTGGRCHKNKTGFDLIGMFVGSEGMLGVITEATLRIIPHPEARAMLTTTFTDFSQAAAAVQAILGSSWLPSALEITDAFTLKAARDYLGEDALPNGNAHLIVELDGRKESVQNEIKELKKFLLTLGALKIQEALDSESCEAIWQLRRDFSYSLRATGLTKLNEDIVVPRSKLVDLVTFARQLQKDTGIAVACFGHAGDGNIHTNLMVDNYDDPDTRKKADAALDQLFKWVLANDGAITGEHGIGLAKKRWYPDAVSEVGRQVHRDLKAALDPNHILNPGKFV
ncbi:MAG: FAD-linked oxidase C-terminal domain-containing protein [Verrucomicrobiota bacterium]